MESTQKRGITWARRSGFVATVASGVTLLGAAVAGIASVDRDLEVAAVERQGTPPAVTNDGWSDDWNDGGSPAGDRRHDGSARRDCPFREREL
jgi:hypothetical protein